jgi:hypothetical protein
LKSLAIQPAVVSSGPHVRCAWSDTPPLIVYSHTSWTILKNGGGGDHGTAKSLVQHYKAAKNEHSVTDAVAVVNQYFQKSMEAWLIDCLAVPLRRNTRIIVVYPSPKFQGVRQDEAERHITNALPGTMAGRVAAIIDAEVNKEIIQIARAGRTALNRVQRLLYQPKFEGRVDPKAVYILVDDAYTLGGTLAALRSHIVTNGGTVGAVCVLCNGTGSSVPFGIKDTQVLDIKKNYGSGIEDYWKKEVGHDVDNLTYNEGDFLLDWARERLSKGDFSSLLQQFRKRIDSARTRGK